MHEAVQQLNPTARPQPLAGPRVRRPDGALEVEDVDFRRLFATAQEEGRPLSWLAVDDLDDETCELAVAPWPHLSQNGRLVFAEREEQYAVAEMPRAELADLAQQAWRLRAWDGGEAVVRPIRVGDVFAAIIDVDQEPGEARAGGHRVRLRFPLGPAGIVDVTADARVFAKVQSELTDTPPLSDEQLTKAARDLNGEDAPG